MTFETLLTLVETIAVVATLFYVAKQIKQSNDLQQSNILMETTDNFTSMMLKAADNTEANELYIDAMAGKKLEGVDKYRAASIMLGIIRVFENMYLQNQRHSFHSSAWPGYRLHMITLLNAPGFKQYMEDRKSFFAPEFVQFIEGETAEAGAWDQYIEK